MAATETDFRGTFPAFKDATKFPAPQVSFYLTMGYKLHNADRWGDCLDFGVMLWAAHNMTLDYESQRMIAAGQNPGTVRGAVTSMSADGVSWARDASSAMNPAAGHWNLSQYGLRWLNLMSLMGAGPLQIGVPTADEISAGDWPWPGVT